jgi:Fe-S-cluster formation regulator IscX/YfhJ
MKKILIYCIVSLLIINSCNERKTDAKPQPKQLNISILLDLSDRIIQLATPSHIERDKEIIKCITEYFKKDMESRSAWRAKGKIKVFFYPSPDNMEINEIAGNLKIDCSNMDNKMRKNVYDSITEFFAKNISAIYNQAIQTKNWTGSDIWRFFKDDLEDYCIERDTNYRNILVILTDGYIYHKNTYFSNGNRYSYLLNQNVSKVNSPTQWMQQIDNKDFGLIKAHDNLSNIEILVLEISDDKNKTNEDVLKYVIEKWFKEMKVSRSKIYSTDLPSNTKARIENFLAIE